MKDWISKFSPFRKWRTVAFDHEPVDSIFNATIYYEICYRTKKRRARLVGRRFDVESCRFCNTQKRIWEAGGRIQVTERFQSLDDKLFPELIVDNILEVLNTLEGFEDLYQTCPSVQDAAKDLAFAVKMCKDN